MSLLSGHSFPQGGCLVEAGICHVVMVVSFPTEQHIFVEILFHESLIKLAACAVIIYSSTVYMPHTSACNTCNFVVSNFVSADFVKCAEVTVLVVYDMAVTLRNERRLNSASNSRQN